MAQLTFVGPGTLEWALVQIKKSIPVTRKQYPKLKLTRQMLEKKGTMFAFGKDSVMATDWIIDEEAIEKANAPKEAAVVG